MKDTKGYMRVPLDCPLPVMNTVTNPETGKWYHREWTKEELALAKAEHFKLVPASRRQG